jgi:hypothetical protein
LIDAPKQVVAWNVIIETEIIKQPRHRYLRPHHRLALQQSL